MADSEALKTSIATFSAELRELKSQHADPAAIETVSKKLGELKKELGKAIAAQGGGPKEDAKKGRLTLKTPKVSQTLTPCIADSSFTTLIYLF